MKHAAAEMTVVQLQGLMAHSRLLTAEQVRAIEVRWRQAGANTDEVAAFAHWLVAQDYLTKYQTAQLIHGQLGALVLGPYTLLDRIGKGNLAIVYKAVHREGQIVALKVLPPSRARDRHLLTRFRNEAELACELRHPHVVRAFQAGEAGGVHFLVLEYLPGENLREAIERLGPLPADDVMHVALQSLLGLQYLFEQGFVHRNLEPANLMLAVPAAADPRPASLRSTCVKILDTSLSRSLFEESVPSGAGQSRLTHEGQILGTPEYLAPEQARDARSCDIRADLYSIGCILYHALTGQPPFHAATPIEVLIRQAVDRPRPLCEIRADVPGELVGVVERLLAKDPDARFASPAAAAEALSKPPPLAAAPCATPVVAQIAQNATTAAPVVPLAIQVAPAAAPAPVDQGLDAFVVPFDSSPCMVARSRGGGRVWLYLIMGALGLLAAQFVGWLVAYLRATAS